MFKPAPSWLSFPTGSIKRRLLVLLVVVVALVILAPTIALRTPIRRLILTRLVPSEVGSVSVEEANVGWLTPLSATNIVILDPAGKPLAEIERLSIDRTLSALVANRRNLGTIRLERLTLHAVVRNDGSNIEDAIATAAEAFGGSEDEHSSAGGIHYRLEVVNGRLLSRHASKREIWGIDAIQATFLHGASGQLHLELTGEAPFPATPQGVVPEPGRFEIALVEDTPQTRTLRVACHQLPLEVAGPWLSRIDPSLQLTGLATGECQLAMSQQQTTPVVWTDLVTGTSSGRLSITDMRLASAAIGQESIAVAQADLAWKGSANEGNLALEHLSLASDYVMLDVRGSLPAMTLAHVGTPEMGPAQFLAAGDLDAEGRVNIARMSQLMPKLMQIRPDTNLTQGEIRFTARSEPHNGGQRLLASVTTTPLAGLSGGKPFSWDAPLAIDLIAHRYAENLRLDQIQCNSEFLRVSATGDPRQMNLEGSFDLDQLTKRLNQFVDLSDWQLAGNGQLKASWQTDQQGRLTAGGSGSLSQLVAIYQGDQLTMEPELTWQATLLGNTENQSLWPTRLRSGQISLDAAGDNLLIDLVEAVDLASVWNATEWPLQIRTTGKLESWTRRLRPWVSLTSYQLSGDLALNAKARIRIEPLRIAITDSTIGIDGLSGHTESWKLTEPRVEWTGDLSWDQRTGTLTSRAGRLVSSTIAASLRDWFWTADMKQAQQVGGLAAIRADLKRITALRNIESQAPDTIEPSGEVVGNVKLASHAGQMMAMIDLTTNQLALTKFMPGLPGQGTTPQVFWQEPSFSLKGTIAYHPALDRASFDGLRIESQTLAAAVGGAIEKFSSSRDLSLAGTIDYDLARLTPILAQYVGEGIILSGREQARFEVAGSLSQAPSAQVHAVSAAGATPAAHWSSRWKGRVLAPWQSITLYGLPVGPGRIAAQLDQSQIAIEPLSFTVAQGQFSAAPQVSLAPAPGEISLPSGPLLTNVQLTPKVTDEMLKYFVPYLTGATQTNGQFSVRLDSARVPLGNPRGVTAAGQLTLHSVKVRPGPEISRVLNIGVNLEGMLKQPGIASLLGGTSSQPVAQLSITDRRIDFWVEQGRVYHQGVEFGSDDFVFRSRGSVGFDQTVSVMIEIPILDKWVKSGHPLRGKTVQLPVSGTLSKLELEEGALLRELARLGLGGQEGAGVIGNEINNALEKLLGGRKRE